MCVRGLKPRLAHTGAYETLIIMRMRNNVKIGKTALFEISVKTIDNLSDQELPMTCMKIKITNNNINRLFNIIKTLLFNGNINTIIDDINNLDIIIPDHVNGYFKIDRLDTANLSASLLNIIDKITTDINQVNFKELTDTLGLKQFLINHIKQPDRIFYRLHLKNIPKVELINSYINNVNKPSWLFNIDHCNNLVEEFLKNINNSTTTIFNDYKDKLNDHYKLNQFLQQYINNLDHPDVIQFTDLQLYYNDINTIYNLYILPYKLTLESEITKGYIKKIKNILTKQEQNYCNICVQLFNELDNLMSGINLKRLVALTYCRIISTDSLSLLNTMLPYVNNFNKYYFYNMLKRKYIYNLLYKNGFYHLFMKAYNI